MTSSCSYIQELAYLDSIVVVVVIISIAVKSEINHLLRMRQKFPEREEGLVIEKIGRNLQPLQMPSRLALPLA
jgi:hypothetical protein